MDPRTEAEVRRLLTELQTTSNLTIEQLLTLLGSTNLPPTPPAAPPKTTPSRSLAWGQHVINKLGPINGRKFIDSVFWIEEVLGIDADDLMACMAFETGERFASNTRNPASSATGLIQFMRKTAIALGTTVEKLAVMPEVNQLNYVYKYFAPYKGRLKNIADVYMAILFPKGIGQAMDWPMMVKGDSNYAANAGLDTNKDHKITKAEAAVKVMEKLTKGLKDPYVWRE